ncbi:MAG TPA: isochorismatase family protein, partial [Terriglobales bacterium]|nr:isochorismatase family protein [Terriglobales bacterium]
AGAEIIPQARLEPALTIPNDAAFRVASDFGAFRQIIIQKNELNVFSNRHADEVLALLPRNGIDDDAEFVVFGVVTEYCVQFAAEGLLQRGKPVAIVTDAIKEIDAASGECSLRGFKSRGARLITSAQLPAA